MKHLIAMFFCGCICFSFIYSKDVYAQTTLQLEATRIKLFSIDKKGFLLSVSRLDVRSAIPNQSICYQANNGEYEVRLTNSHPYFKEMIAFILSAYLNKKPFALVASNPPTCEIDTFVLLDK